MPPDGTLVFARYAFMPNRLNYCGGDDNRNLFDYCVEAQTDAGLVTILEQFQAALPYLKLIAGSNGIADPFDIRVVEAYWIGNELLDRVDLVRFYDSLHDRFARRLNPKTLAHLLSQPPRGARPHHSFHVFDVHNRVGMLEHNLPNLDSCRIGWGRVEEMDGPYYLVEYQPIILESGRLALGAPVKKRVLRQIDGRGFAGDCRAGDWVSFHWDWVCDRLNAGQVSNLDRYTRHHLALANRFL